MRSRLTLAATLVSLAGTPATAQGIESWDADGDRALDKAEFTQGLLDSGVLEEWDTDGDQAIGYSELSSGLYAAWDVSDDGELSADEWDGAVDLCSENST